MPDVPVEPAAPGRYPGDMESRGAVLEQIARETTASLGRIERRVESEGAELRALIATLAREQRADFRWLLGIVLAGVGALLGVMAHGFHWL